MKSIFIILVLCSATLLLAQNPNVTLTGTIQGPNGLPVANTVISFTPTQSFFVAGSGGSALCGGYTVQINGTVLTCGDTLNFNSTTPVAPTNGVNVTFAHSIAGATDNVSAAVVGDGNPAHCLVGTGTFSPCLPNPANFLGPITTPGPVTVGPSSPPGIAAFLFNTCDPIGMFNSQGFPQLSALTDPATGNCSLAWSPDGIRNQRVFTTAYQSVPYRNGDFYAYNSTNGDFEISPLSGGYAGVSPITISGTNIGCATCVTSVALGVPAASTFNVTGSPLSGPGGTLTLGVSGNQGGIPWYDTPSTLNSSALLAQYGFVFGGGTGTPPASSSTFGTNANNSLVFNLGAIASDIVPFQQTWTTNNAGTTFSGMKWIATNVAQAAGSFNFQWCGGSSGSKCATLDPSGNFATPGTVTAGVGSAVAGVVAIRQGTLPSPVAGAWNFTSPTAVTGSPLDIMPPTAAQGILTGTLSGSTITNGFSGDANHSATVSTSTATSIGSTSLCSTTFCPVGTYRVSAYIDVTTACTTTGAYLVSIIYTDDTTVSKTIVMPLIGTGVTATLLGPAANSSSLSEASTVNFGQGSMMLRSTGAASINYSTTATACGSGGPGLGKLYLAVEAVQ